MENRCNSKFVIFITAVLLIGSSKLFSFEQIQDLKALKIKCGAEQMNLYIQLLKNKRIGLVVNQSSLINGVHLADTLVASGINVVRIFAPEHGFRGIAEAGAHIADDKDTKTGIKIISLYGKKYKPDSNDLAGLDLIVYDVQDVGVRFFTYISTLHYVMESCAENNVALMILDRPNPNGHYVDGPVLDTAFKSFIGMDPIPVVYGLTQGELAGMIKGECWINKCNSLNLKVIACKNYLHSSKVKLDVRPSPNLPNDLAIALYPSLCFFEGTVISVGRGTSFPFQAYGHPDLYVNGCFRFTPVSMPEAINPPWKDSLCYGFDLRNMDLNALREEKRINLHYLLNAFKKLNIGQDFFLKNHFIDKLAGSDSLRKQILNQETEHSIRESWKNDLMKYKSKSKKYLLYN
jgi:uncharacterized protein YbbC (DUF1343 family)